MNVVTTTLYDRTESITRQVSSRNKQQHTLYEGTGGGCCLVNHWATLGLYTFG